jgi:hypothetical protein
MSDDQRKQEVLAAEDAIRRLAAEMKTQSEMSVRFEAEARTLNESRMALSGMGESVRQAMDAMEHAQGRAGKAFVEIAEGISVLESRVSRIIQAGNERMAGMDAKMDKNLSEQSSQAEFMRSALEAQSTRIAALESLFLDVRDTLVSLTQTAREVSIMARVAVGLGIVSVGGVAFLAWVLHK